MRALIVLLLLCCVVVVAVRAVESDHEFLFDDAGQRRMVTVFTGSMRHRQPLHIDYGSNSGTGDDTLALVSRGHHRWFKFLRNESSRLSLQLGAANPLWARWRYAALSNLSLRLTNTPPLLLATATTRLPCARSASSSYLCVVNETLIVEPGNHSHVLGRHPLVIDPDREKSSLPPDLYFLLTNGRARWHKYSSATTTDQRFDMSTAMRITCVDVLLPASSSSVRICEHDMVWFELGGIRQPAERDMIVLANAFWITNTTHVVMDGWTNEIQVQYSQFNSMSLALASMSAGSPNVAALLWCCLAIALGCIIGLYSRWINYPATPNVGLVLWHIWRADAQTWAQDYRMMLNLLGLVAAACGTTLVVALSYGYLPPEIGGGPYWQVLILGLLCYGLVQTVLAVLLSFFAEARPMASARCCSQPSETSIPVAWARHLTQGTGALAFACAALVPLAYDGSVSASMVPLFIPFLTAMALLYHHTYYGVVFIGLVASSVRGLQHGQRLWLGLLAIFQVLLLAGLAAVLAVFYLAPVVDAASPFFAEAWNYLLAVILMVLVMVGACVWIMAEVRLAAVKRTLKKTQ